jgi:hypothetical protein
MSSQSLVDTLASLHEMKSVDLRDEGLTAEEASMLAHALKTNTSVTSVDLEGNAIGTKGALALADTLKVNTSVASIDLRNNAIGDEGASALADALKVNTLVASIELRNNAIGDEGASALADALKVNTLVSYVDLGGNAIGSPILLLPRLSVVSAVMPFSAGATALAPSDRILLPKKTDVCERRHVLQHGCKRLGTVGTYLVVAEVERRKRRHALQRGCKRLGTVGTYLVAAEVERHEHREHRVAGQSGRQFLCAFTVHTRTTVKIEFSQLRGARRIVQRHEHFVQRGVVHDLYRAIARHRSIRQLKAARGRG